MSKHGINIGGTYEIYGYKTIVESVDMFGANKIYVHSLNIGWQDIGEKYSTTELKTFIEDARWLPTEDEIEEIEWVIKNLEL